MPFGRNYLVSREEGKHILWDAGKECAYYIQVYKESATNILLGRHCSFTAYGHFCLFTHLLSS